MVSDKLSFSENHSVSETLLDSKDVFNLQSIGIRTVYINN